MKSPDKKNLSLDSDAGSERRLLYAQPLAELVERVKKEGSENILFDAAEKYLDTLNVELVYESEKDNPEIEEMRRRLNTEAGVIISNHPGYFDVLTLLHLIRRQDIKIMAGHFEEISEILGPENFLPAPKDPAGLVKLMKEIRNHIKSGGVLLIFPTGGQDSVSKPKEKRRFEFQSGFRHLVEKVLEPDDMVYSFNVDPKGIADVINESIPRPLGSVSAVLADINPNMLKERKPIRVKENYSTAEEWKRVVAESSREEVNKELSEHYLEKFEIK